MTVAETTVRFGLQCDYHCNFQMKTETIQQKKNLLHFDMHCYALLEAFWHSENNFNV